MAQIVQLVLHCMKFLLVRHGGVVWIVAECIAGMLSFAEVSFLNSIVKEIVFADTLYVYLFSRRSTCSSFVKLRMLVTVPFLRQ